MKRSLYLILSLTLVATVGLASPLAAQAKKKPKRKVPVGFFATVLEPETEGSGVSDATMDSTFGSMARSGVESLRVTFAWSVIEPLPNVYNFTVTDRLARDAAEHRIGLLANLISTPAWASTGPAGIFSYRYAPKSPQLFADFVTTLVKRYGPHGSFWKQNPGLPNYPIHQWQIWNEEGFNVFWASSPWPQTYLRILKAAYTVLHHYDHAAKVVAGSFAADAQSNQWQQMTALYKAGGKHYFDMISVHPFTTGKGIPVSESVKRAIEIIQFVHNVMVKHGDAHKPIILTELTWPGAVGFVKPSRLIGLEATPKGEIQRLVAAYNYLATHQRQTDVKQAYWYSWGSTFNANDPQSDVGYRFAGLNKFAHGTFIPQPPLRTYARLAAQYEGCIKNSNGQCR